MISYGYIAGTSFAFIVVCFCVWLALTLKRYMDSVGEDDFDYALAKWSRRISLATVPLVAAIWVATTWPSFDMKYHSYNEVTGQVTSISQRLVTEGDGMSEKYVFVIDGQEYGCTDTRCGLVIVGDTVTLSCITVWEYAGTDGYDCKWVSKE